MLSMQNERSDATNGNRPTREVIVEHALDSFSEIGYEGTSIRAIAALAGIQPASIYAHFPSKEALLWGIIDRMQTTMMERARQQIDGVTDPVERLRTLVRHHVIMAATRQREARIVTFQVLSLDAEHLDIALKGRREYEGWLISAIEAGKKAGKFNVENPIIASHAILQMTTGIAFWYRTEGEFTVTEIADQYEEFSLRVLGYQAAVT